jgi:hypothetical protein
MNLGETKIYQVTWAFNTLDEEDFKRAHPEDLWDDLWTDHPVYDQKFREENQMDISRILNVTAIPKGLPNKIVMLGWFDFKKQNYQSITCIGQLFQITFLKLLNNLDLRIIA